MPKLDIEHEIATTRERLAAATDSFVVAQLEAKLKSLEASRGFDSLELETPDQLFKRKTAELNTEPAAANLAGKALVFDPATSTFKLENLD